MAAVKPKAAMGNGREHVHVRRRVRPRAADDERNIYLWFLTRPIAHRVPRYSRRYMEIFRTIRKYQLHYAIAEINMGYRGAGAQAAPRVASPALVKRAESFAAALEELGPCFIKLGQLLSTRPDILPPVYISALSRLQNRIRPVPVSDVVAIVERELGAPIAELFSSFDPVPVATASMAQVHRAQLPDGTEVAVKVQRPGVQAMTKVDIQILKDVIRFARKYTASGTLANLNQMVRELEHGLIGDMDFLEEAANTRRINRQLSEFERLSTADVYPEYSTSTVLTLSFVHGRNLSKYSREEIDGMGGADIAGELLSAYLKQIVVDGIFHCDPHPGNILVTEDGQLVLLDCGMVGRFDANEQDKIIDLLLAFSEREGDRVADIYMQMVEVPAGLDRRSFKEDVSSFVSRYHDLSGGRMGLGTMFLDLLRLIEEHRAPVPSTLTLLAKALLNLDGIVTVLSPELDPVQLIRDYMWKVMEKRAALQVKSGKQISWALDMWRLMENAPRRAELILSKLANDELHMHMEIEHLHEASKRVSGAANRLSGSIVLGSLVVAGGYVLGSLLRSREGRANNGRK